MKITKEKLDLLKECKRYGINTANDLHTLVEERNEYRGFLVKLKIMLDLAETESNCEAVIANNYDVRKA